MAKKANPKVNQDAFKEIADHLAKCPFSWDNSAYHSIHDELEVHREQINELFALAEERVTQLEELGFKSLARVYRGSINMADQAISYAKWSSRLNELIQHSYPNIWDQVFEDVGEIKQDKYYIDPSSYKGERIPF